MAFGDTQVVAKASGSGTGDKKRYNKAQLKLELGTRTLRFLRARNPDGSWKMIPDPLKAERMIHAIPDEVTYASFFLNPAYHKGVSKAVTVILPPEARYDNPIFEKFYKDQPRDKQQAARLMVAFNVLDRTPVIKSPIDGLLLYPDKDGVHYEMDERGYKPTDVVVKGKPEPANRIAVLEVGSGKKGGSHLFAEFCDYIEGLSAEDPETGEQFALSPADLDTNIRSYMPPGETDFRKMKRNFRQGSRRPIDDALWDLPVYDLAGFYLKPWPFDAIEQVLDGADPYQVMKDRNIPGFPRLVTVENEGAEEEEDDTEALF